MNISYKRGGKPQGPLANIVAIVLGLLTLVAAFMFSLVFLVVLVVAGVVVWLYFWWQTRALRRQMREQRQAHRETMHATHDEAFGARAPAPTQGADIIEGEAVRVTDETHGEDRQDPPSR